MNEKVSCDVLGSCSNAKEDNSDLWVPGQTFQLTIKSLFIDRSRSTYEQKIY